MTPLNETIDLCDSEEESNEKKRIKMPVEAVDTSKVQAEAETVEIITLDDTVSPKLVPNFCGSPSTLARQTSRLSLRSAEEGEIESEDEIQIIQETRSLVPAMRKSPKFALAHDPSAFFAIDRRPSGTRNPFKTGPNQFLISQGGISKKKKKKKGKGRGKIIPSNNFGPEVSTVAGRKALNRIKNEARRQAIRELVPNPMARPQLSHMTHNNRRDKHAPIMQNGVPKFRLKPAYGHTDDDIPGSSSGARTVQCQASSSDGAASDALDHFRITVNNPAPATATTATASVVADCGGQHVPDSAEVQIEVGTSHIHVTNAYNSGPVEKRRKGDLRPIIIDASNVAFGHGNGAVYSCRGIKICCDYFKARGHKVYAFMPSYRKKSGKSKDAHILHELEKQGVAKFTPSREVAGETIASYDDRFILGFANDSGGIVVSNDNYRDLYNEQPQWRDTIRNRLLPYTWISDTYIMFPPDPLGPTGPNLDDFLRF